MVEYVYIIQDVEGVLGVFKNFESLEKYLRKSDKDEHHKFFSHHSEVQRWILDTADYEFVCKTKDVEFDESIESGWFKGDKYL